MYSIVEGSKGPKRSFSITCGIQKGYAGDGVAKIPAQAISTILNWMQQRSESKKDFLTGKLYEGGVLYAWPDKDITVTAYEPIIEFKGEVSHLYNQKMSDEDVIDVLNDLASVLGEALGQVRVYVTYNDESWILQNPNEETPTGETISEEETKEEKPKERKKYKPKKK